MILVDRDELSMLVLQQIRRDDIIGATLRLGFGESKSWVVKSKKSGFWMRHWIAEECLKIILHV
ncbi:hypothetical protein ISN44_As05g031080 [Arabidopsis suecica]|uniref:Uncharacterized protein n=1 Tax=Arabidopsis suecica TaxID=45249 RepID=A0A8T2DUH3_ARASU|nr:hypothetical protein ISN44_As05g031080 [Arabidopsis suecica]